MTPVCGAAQSASVTIGGQPAMVLYAGSAPDLVQGVLQVNVQIPDQAPSGAVPIGLAIGGIESKQPVTIAVE